MRAGSWETLLPMFGSVSQPPLWAPFNWCLILGGRARTHQVLQQKYYDILARVEAMAADDQKEICQLSGDMVRIYADEPPIADVPDAVAYNAAAKALGSSDEECFKISKWTRIAATLFPFFPFRLRTHSEIAKDCAKAHG